VLDTTYLLDRKQVTSALVRLWKLLHSQLMNSGAAQGVCEHNPQKRGNQD